MASHRPTITPSGSYHARKSSGGSALKKSASSTKVHRVRAGQHHAGKKSGGAKGTRHDVPDHGHDHDDEDEEVMAQPFLQFCYSCGKMIPTPESRLYCSMECSRRDSGDLTKASPPATPSFMSHTFSFESLSISRTDSIPNIIPLRSPTSSHTAMNRWSMASLDSSTGTGAMKRTNSATSQSAADYLASFFPPALTSTLPRPRERRHRPTKSEAPSLSNTPSSYETSAFSVPATPIGLRKSAAASDFSSLNWATRPTLPPRHHPFSSSYGRVGDISLVTPFHMSKSLDSATDEEDSRKEHSVNESVNDENAENTPRVTTAPEQTTTARRTVPVADIAFEKKDINTDESTATTGAACAAASPKPGALNRLFNFEQMRRAPSSATLANAVPTDAET